MKIGALILTTGLPKNQGVAALLEPSGSVSAGQRMIAAFHRCGVHAVGLVIGPENKKLDRQLAQNGVIFLHCPSGHASVMEAARVGLSYMADKFDRIFIACGNLPLFLPETLQRLLACSADIAVPVYQHVNGCPVLVSGRAAEMILADPDARSLEEAVFDCAAEKEFVPVKDPSVIVHADAPETRMRLIEVHNRQLTRPTAQVTLTRGIPLYDGRLSMLLHLVDETRSVRLACNLMQISYSTAWGMLNHVEDQLGFPLITRIRGGASGSGSELTVRGRKLMEAYDRFSESINQSAQLLYGQIFCDLPD